MKLPLEKDYQNPALRLYMRQTSKPPDEDSSGGDVEPLFKYVDAANRFYRENADLLTEIHMRQMKQMESLKEGWSPVELRGPIAGRLVTGTSHGRIWNSSLLLDALYGFPYVAASGVKGALAHWAEETESTKTVSKMLGGPEEMSRILFWDVFPEAQTDGKLLRLDVVTPHHAEYYMNEAPAADWDVPVPVPSVTLAPNVRLVFRCVVRNDANREDLKNVMKEMLTKAGVGAKTRKGYGRLGSVEETQ